MCKLMFGEHREKITQIILTAAEENVCFAPLRESLGEMFFFSFFLPFLLFLSFSEKQTNSSLSGSDLSIIKKQKGKGVAGK